MNCDETLTGLDDAAQGPYLLTAVNRQQPPLSAGPVIER
jgi:hypothetical protein